MSRSLVVVGLAGPLLSLAGLAGGQEPPRTVLPAAAECAERLRKADAEPARAADEGPARLEQMCADLAGGLDEVVWGRALVSVRPEELSARALRELVGLIEHYGRERANLAAFRADDLSRIVDSLGPFEPIAELSPWERMLRWIERRLGLDDESGGNRLADWLRSIAFPSKWVPTIVAALGALAVAGVLAVVLNEIRARRSRPLARFGGVGAGARRSVPRGIDDVRAAPPSRQPGLLLALVIDRVRARFGVDVRDSMTPRELAVALGTIGIERRDDLEAVVAAAERAAFAGWRPRPADIDAVIGRGRAVLDELDDDRAPR